ncbi:hypothetical protein PybrP1_000001, partial [[Pythium] brassicae (nom. inval.)]
MHKADFFARLAAMQFPDDSRHLVLGDINVVLDPSIDSATGEVRDAGARQQALRWLAQLGVVDPRNRLDYILVDGPTVTHHYSGAEYFAHHHGGWPPTTPGIAGSVAGSTRAGSLLAHSEVAGAITNEAADLLATLKDANNSGLVWDAWKRKCRDFLQQLDAGIRREAIAEVRKAAALVEQANADFIADPGEATQVRLADARA